jgi:hypothetical protein
MRSKKPKQAYQLSILGWRFGATCCWNLSKLLNVMNEIAQMELITPENSHQFIVLQQYFG